MAKLTGIGNLQVPKLHRSSLIHPKSSHLDAGREDEVKKLSQVPC